MFRLSAIGFGLIGTLIIAAPLGAQDNCEHRRELSATVDATGSDRVRIDAGSGTLTIIGRPGLSQIRATGTACASSASQLEEMRIDADRRGGDSYLETVIPSSGGWFSRSGYARIDLEVEVPEGASLRVDDGSGSIIIRNVGAIELSDGSGSIGIEDVRGDIRLGDGSGSTSVRNVEGDIRISDGSGSISIENVRGSVIVEDDGSGSITIRQVTRDVLVQDDGSGSINVHRVGGDFTVERDGSGGIDYGEIAGRVDVPRRR